MPEESGEVTAEQMLAAAQQYDAAVDAGKTPEVVIQSEEPKEEVQDESPPEPAEEAVQEPETEVLNSTEDDADEQVSSLTEGEAPEAAVQEAAAVGMDGDVLLCVRRAGSGDHCADQPHLGSRSGDQHWRSWEPRLVP